MRHSILAAVLVVMFAGLAFSQPVNTNGLVLTGSLTVITPRINRERSKPLFHYELRLYMQLRNDGPETLIVLRPGPLLPQRRVAFVSGMATGSGYDILNFKPAILPTPSRSYLDPMPGFVRSLDTKQPVSNELLILEPGRYHEYLETVVVEDGYRLEIRPGQSLDEVSRNTPIAEDLGFRLEYSLSVKKYHPNDGFLKMLQERWKPFGHLVLNGNGDFFVRSDVILNPQGR